MKRIEMDVMFDGPPGPESGRLIEVHDAKTGESITWGEWLDNGDGTWSLIGPALIDDSAPEHTFDGEPDTGVADTKITYYADTELDPEGNPV